MTPEMIVSHATTTSQQRSADSTTSRISIGFVALFVSYAMYVSFTKTAALTWRYLVAILVCEVLARSRRTGTLLPELRRAVPEGAIVAATSLVVAAPLLLPLIVRYELRVQNWYPMNTTVGSSPPLAHARVSTA